MLHLSRSRMLAATGSALALWPSIIRAQTLDKIRLTGVPTDDLTPVYYAIKNGLYQKAGLDVEIVRTSSGTAATEAVISGAYEMGKGSLIAALVAHLKGLPLTIVGNGAIWDPKSPFSMMVVAADSTVKTGADLNGKILSTAALNDLNQLAMNAWIDKTGGDSKTLKWIELPNSAAGAALAEHRVEATCLNEPQLSAAVETGKVRVLAPCYIAISEHFVFTIYFAQPEWAAKHPDAIKKWVRVTYGAAAYTNTHHAETAAMMADVTKIPEAIIAKMARVNGSTSGDPALIQPCIDMAAKY
ncbi:MAG TPA: ABC transporter substrate-binding protein, partial [Candidatus Baltobacteraceae bacterium]|nr:ABC transporter substrate-binding protein [Candidatus Baltobacteraceae bacterium]